MTDKIQNIENRLTALESKVFGAKIESKRIILKDGTEINLSDYQKREGLMSYQIAPNFNLSEYAFNLPSFELSELILQVLQEYRKRIDKPVKVNSAYRSQEKQKELRKQGYRAATFSPHCEGMAVDIDTRSNSETQKGVELLRQISKDLGIKIRIGWEQYQKEGQTFIHVDVCPEYYAKGQPYYSEKNPPQWQNAIEW